MPHIHAQIDFVVSCFIVWDRRVLLIKHKKLRTWLPIGGHVELHQTTDEAMDAEIAEEAGVPVEFVEPGVLRPWPAGLRTGPPHHEHNSHRLRTPWAVEIHDFPGVAGHRHLALVYFARALSGDVKLEEGAHDAIEWFTPFDVERMRRRGEVLDTIAWYAGQAIDFCDDWQPGDPV